MTYGYWTNTQELAEFLYYKFNKHDTRWEKEFELFVVFFFFKALKLISLFLKKKGFVKFLDSGYN